MTDFKFFNRPSSIGATLDKVRMKEILVEKNIRILETLTSRVYNTKDLLDLLEESKSYNVFIKSRYGSGALGVMALKCNFKRNDYLGRISRIPSVKKLGIETNGSFLTEDFLEAFKENEGDLSKLVLWISY